MAADEEFLFAFAVTGEDSGARAFENLKLRQLEAAQEASKLSAEFRKLQQSGEATEAEIEEMARAMIRAKQAAAGYGQQAAAVQREQRRASSATQATTQAQNANAISSMAMVQQVGAIANSLGQLGSFIGQTNPKLAQFGHSLGEVASAAGAGGAAFGPWGAAVGGAIGVVTALIGHLEREREAHLAAAAAVRRQATDLGILQENISQADHIADMISGLGTLDEQTQAVTESQARLRAEHRRLDTTQGELSRASTSLERVEAQLAARAGENSQAVRDLHRLQREYQSQIRGLEADVRGFTVSLQAQQETAVQLASALRDVEAAAAETARMEFQAAKDRQANENRNAQAASQAEERRARGIAAHRARVEETRRIDEAGDRASETFHQNALARIAEITRELETTGDILDPTARAAQDAARAMEQAFSVSDTAAAERVRSQLAERASQRRRAQASLRTEGDTTGADLEAYRAFVATRVSSDEEVTQRYQSQLHAREDAHRAHMAALRDMEAGGTEWTAEQFQRRRELHAQMIADERADQQLRQDHLRQAGQITKGMWDSIGGSVLDAAGQMFKFVIEGAEGGGDAFLAMLDQFLEATAIEYTIKALAELANGVAAVARGDVRAAFHFQAAGMAAAVAAATGIASAAIPSAPSSGASSGGGTQVQPSAGSAGAGGPANVTINMYSPNAIQTEAERGAMITRSLREARRQLGPGAVRI